MVIEEIGWLCNTKKVDKYQLLFVSSTEEALKQIINIINEK